MQSGVTKVLTNAALATMATPVEGLGAVAINDGLIAWVGPADDLPAAYQEAEKLDMQGRLVTPALIDCHTHIVLPSPPRAPRRRMS